MANITFLKGVTEYFNSDPATKKSLTDFKRELDVLDFNERNEIGSLVAEALGHEFTPLDEAKRADTDAKAQAARKAQGLVKA